MDNISYTTYQEYLNVLLAELKSAFGKGLLGLVLLGSIARGKGRLDSDLDILLVHNLVRKEAEEKYSEVRMMMRKSEAHKNLLAQNIRPIIAPLLVTVSELSENPLILLDIIDHGIVLYDYNRTIKKLFEKMKVKLGELGAKKVVLNDENWLWDLKPDWKPGEVIEIKL